MLLLFLFFVVVVVEKEIERKTTAKTQQVRESAKESK